MIWDRTKTLAILSNFYVYMVPSVSIFGELYNLRVIEDELQDQVLRSEFHSEQLLPRFGLQKTVDNVIARKSAEFFLQLVEDSKFHVTDQLDYNVFISEIDYAIEQLNSYDGILYDLVLSNDKDVPLNEMSVNFISALNNRQNEIQSSEIEDGVAETFFNIPIETRLSVED
jgi:hypothetical protein